MMKPLLVLLMMITSLLGCTTAPKDTIMQVSTIDALLASVYDGQMSCKELLKHGDFGLGTFDRLDGEMIVLDGTVYQAKSTGQIEQPDPSITTPFATVIHFDPDLSAPARNGINFAGLQQQIDQLSPNTNLFCAVKVSGSFPYIKVRAVPAQTKPYPPLTEVAKHQPVFEYKNQTGTIVGFRCPAFVKGLNVTGYHLHFLSDDKTKGGHLLDFTLEKARIELDRCNRFYMVLPEHSKAFQQTDLSTDRSDALHKVEH